MRYVAWLWCILMFGSAMTIAAQGEIPGIPFPHGANLALGAAFSAFLVLPPLWEGAGSLGGLGLPAASRAALALLMPLICALAGTPFGLDSFARPPILAA